MVDKTILDWGDVDVKDTCWNTLLLGNGASMAIHSGFGYKNLADRARELPSLKDITGLFDEFGTTNFEEVLQACWTAQRVNSVLAVDSACVEKAYQAYQQVRDALVGTVVDVHPEYTAAVKEKLARIGSFASKFRTVISLNYDVTFYWAMLLFNETNGTWFKDCFCEELSCKDGKGFKEDWGFLRKPHHPATCATLVFYPHGNLILGRGQQGQEIKLAAGKETDLLKSITTHWGLEEYLPIFVSEGGSPQKLAAIRRSPYLLHVYQKVLPALFDSEMKNSTAEKKRRGLVVYGWSFNENDMHVLKAIFSSENPPEHLAVSVHCHDTSDEQQQEFCEVVKKLLEKAHQQTFTCPAVCFLMPVVPVVGTTRSLKRARKKFCVSAFGINVGQ